MQFRRRTLVLSACLAAAMPFGTWAQGNDIVVAHIGPFTVLPVPDAKQLDEGMQAAIGEINDAGGINGRKLKMLSLDDAYSYDGFVKQLKVARDAGAVALLSPLGSATLKGVLDNKLLDSNDLVVINAVPGASVLRSPGHPMWFHVRAGDDQQIEKIVAHAKTLTIPSMAVLYQDIPMGTSGLASAQKAAKDVGGIEIKGVQSAFDPAALDKAAKELAATNAKSALVIGMPKFAGEGIAALRKAGVNQQIFTLSYLPAPALSKMAGDGARGVGIAQTFPNPAGIRIGLQRDFSKAMTRYQPEVKTFTSFHVEGYITAQIFAQAARKAAGASAKEIAQSMRRMGEVNLGGFRLDFSKGNTGSNWVDIGVVTQDGKLMY